MRNKTLNKWIIFWPKYLEEETSLDCPLFVYENTTPTTMSDLYNEVKAYWL